MIRRFFGLVFASLVAHVTYWALSEHQGGPLVGLVCGLVFVLALLVWVLATEGR